ncbi:MAG TPA: P-loop guanosine triphosphatase YjiA [Hyphomicrobiaceae bacterium MAG_BT-2024]
MAFRIPVTIITGLLGVGKTTLISSLLTKKNDKKIALIVNEFGSVGGDGAILANNCREDIIELTDGCICCTVSDEFIPSMEMLLEREPSPDHIIIETSGIALPQPLLQAFKWPPMQSRIALNVVIAVVDLLAISDGFSAEANTPILTGENVEHHTTLLNIFDDQLSCADLIVLNKRDLILNSKFQGVNQYIDRKKRHGAKVVSAIQGNIPLELIVGQEAHFRSNDSISHTHYIDHDKGSHGHDAYETFAINIRPAKSSHEMKRIVSKVAKNNKVLRIKGFAVITDKPMRLTVQAVGPRVQVYFDRRWNQNEQPQGCLVVIGLKGLDKEKIASELAGVPV